MEESRLEVTMISDNKGYCVSVDILAGTIRYVCTIVFLTFGQKILYNNLQFSELTNSVLKLLANRHTILFIVIKALSTQRSKVLDLT